MAALNFCYDTLRNGGHFLCKFYAGAEDNALEKKLKRLFEKVHREKPDSSRNVSMARIPFRETNLTCNRLQGRHIL